MMNHKIRTATLAALAVMGSFSGAALAETGYVEAPVIDVTPLYQTHRVPVTREECWEEEVRHRRRGPANPTATIVGGIIGGAVGNRVGGGRGRDAATVAGVLLGASIGNDVSRQGSRRGRVTVEERCEVVRDYAEEERLDGYRVRYEMDGRTYTTRTRHDPGETIRLRVSFSPAE